MVTINVDNNILLRSYQVKDADALFDTISASRSHLHPWLAWVGGTTKPEHSLQFINHSLQQLDNQEALALGIFINDKVAGGVGMHNWDQATKRAQVGYWISKEYEGKGIVSQCLSAFITFLFNNIGLNKAEIHFMAGNKRSGTVAMRLGFTTEGVIRKSLMRNGMAEDVVVMGLLKSEWAAGKLPNG